ncbi:MAG TPA: M64 family metallopeptidase, partial [Saprospiraceae bacterium]|nr:M64 family metallopeptidase [Saprospiraceae bacterium]
MEGWWFGNNKITLQKIILPSDNLFRGQVLPSIYGVFDTPPGQYFTGIVGDITGHGYVTLTSSDNSVFQIEDDGINPILKDRLTGIEQTISPAFAQLNGVINNVIQNPLLAGIQSIEVHVRNDYNQNNPILERIKYNGSINELHNILILSEGFTDDSDNFDWAIRHIKQRMFEKPRHSPFLQLEGNFNLWAAFTPSTEWGVSIGFNIGRITFNNISGITADTLLQDHDSFFGFYRGNRLGEYNSTKTSMPYSNYSILHDGPYSISPDPRKFPPLVTTDRPIYKFINKLADPLLNVSGTPDPSVENPIGNIWDMGQNGVAIFDQTGNRNIKNFGLVGIMVYDHMSYGVNIVFNKFFLFCEPGANFKTMKFDSNHFKIDNLPPADGGIQLIRKRIKDINFNVDFKATVDTFVHELSHSLQLGDEYERIIGGGNSSNSDGYDNLVHKSKFEIPGSGILGNDGKLTTELDPIVLESEIPWNLNRIELSSKIVSVPNQTGDKLTFLIDCDKRNSGKWIKSKQDNKKVFLRKISIELAQGTQLPISNFAGGYIPELPSGLNGFKITHFNKNTGEVTLEINNGISYSLQQLAEFKNGLLFVPLLNNIGSPLMLVSEAAITIMKQKSLPLFHNHVINAGEVHNNCRRGKGAAQVSPYLTTTHPIPSRIIGLYEGGDDISCNLYHPTGQCKMRNQVTGDDDLSLQGLSNEPMGKGEFCFVCKYLIVNRIDPNKHDLLESDDKYPEP